MSGARNPKGHTFSVRVADGINERLEHLCDISGQNKSAMAGLLLAAGLNLMEPVFMVGVQRYADMAAEDKTRQLLADVVEAGNGIVKK